MAGLKAMVIGILHLSVLLFFTRVEATSKDKSPVNILFVMADQLRQDAVGCYGNKLAKTPNMDWLASQGARFTNVYTSTPSCTPARAAILTGLSPWYHGMLGYGAIARRYPIELPRSMSTSGYYAYSIGKDHFGWDKTAEEGIPHGFNGTNLYDGLSEEMDDYDQWFAENFPGVDPLQATGLGWNDYPGRTYALPEFYHPTAWVGRQAVNFLETYNQEEPFFLKVSFHRPHSPYDPPGRLMDMFTPQEMPKPYLGDKWDQDCNFKGNLRSSLCCGHIEEDVVAVSRQAYYGNVAFVDEWIGNILDVLRNRSLLDKTVILFTADHGDMLGDHYRWRKILPYESSSKIPMLFTWPPSMEKSQGGPIGCPRGTVKDEIIELRDIFPTFLDVGGLSTPPSLNGSSLLHLLADPSSSVSWREYIDMEHTPACNQTFHWNGYSDGKFKYVFEAFYPREQLFDLVNDPHEMHNLADDKQYSDELLKWRKRLIKQFESEDRGKDWVWKGKLQKRIKSHVYSPHYPDNERSKACPPDLNEEECSWYM